MTTSFAFAAESNVNASSHARGTTIRPKLYSRIATLEANIAELKERNEYLLRLHTEKNDWLQMLVHDLKNPLASITLAGSFLERYWQRMSLTEFRRYTATIQESASRMNTLISRVLSLGALESGALDLALDHINPAQALLAAVQEYAVSGSAKDIEILCEIEPEPAFIYADRCALVEIIDNLLSNAVKYSPRGSRVIVRSYTDAAQNLVRIEIQDRGPGIKPEEFDKLFTKFARLSSKPTGGENSTGLGLAITHKLATSMHGAVRCESEFGQGATFIVEFPRSTPKQYLEVVDYAQSDEQEVPLAIKGFDAVGYFLLGRPLAGDDHIAAEWKGKKWLFANEYHRELFINNPERFAPKFQGFCALGMSRNYAAAGDPESWTIVNDELFFLFNDESLQEWQSAQSQFIAEANEKWNGQAFDIMKDTAQS